MHFDLEELEEELENVTIEELNTLFADLAGFTQSPVSIDEFLDSPEFLGEFFSGGLYPYWRKVLRDIYPSPHYTPSWMVVLRGSVGQGKTSIACAGIAYDLYRLICMINPQKHFNLVSSTKIVFALINRTLTLAGDVVWDKLSQIFVQSPFFNRLLHCSSDGKISRRRLTRDTLFPHRIDFIVGSRSGHALGQAVFSAILSEANFQVVEDQMYHTFNNLLRRMESRFMTVGGGIPGRIWIDSSESDKFSVVNRIVESWKKSKGVYISQAAIWDVKGHLTDQNGTNIYSGNRFWVFCGSETRGPEIIDDTNQGLLTQYPEQCMHVPVEHFDAFNADINEAIRDLGGRSTVSSSKVFRLREKLNASLNVSMLFPPTVQLDFDDDNSQLFNFAYTPTYFAKPFHAHMPRYLHIDVAVSGDRMGFAASYISGFKDIKYRDPTTFEETVTSVPEFVTEWCFGVEPSPGKQIPLFKLKFFVQWLAQQGYPIGAVTADGFQSTQLLQELKKDGYITDVISVDRTITPYISMRSMIYEGRASLPANPILKVELEELEINATGDKIDHTPQSTKDLADSCAGSLYNANMNSGSARLFHAIPEEKTQDQEIASMFWQRD